MIIKQNGMELEISVPDKNYCRVVLYKDNLILENTYIHESFIFYLKQFLERRNKK